MPYSITEAAPLEFETFKRGMGGWPVIVCQVALNSHYKTPPLILDGVFGPKTEACAKEVQAALGITQDGVVGPETQAAFVKAKCKHAELNTTPAGLLAGICNMESSYSWPCVSPENSNGTHDYGPTQESLYKPSEADLLHAFNPDAAAHTLASECLTFYRQVVGRVGEKRAWELSALNHNWPAAAWAIAEGDENWLNKPFAFTTAKGYTTGLAYAEHYIATAVNQVTNWKP